MNYQELINNIQSLGFSDADEIQEFAESGVLYDSINRAITEINLNIAPIYGRYEFEITEEDTGYLYITMPDVDDLFLEFTDTPVLYEKDGTQYYQKFSDYQIEADDTVVINADENKGSFRIFYKMNHDTFTGEDRELRMDLPLPLKAHHLVPLLASYYVWQEDEPVKAAQYYNMFEQRSQDVTEQSQSMRAYIMPGGI